MNSLDLAEKFLTSFVIFICAIAVVSVVFNQDQFRGEKQ